MPKDPVSGATPVTASNTLDCISGLSRLSIATEAAGCVSMSSVMAVSVDVPAPGAADGACRFLLWKFSWRLRLPLTAWQLALSAW